MRLLMINEIHQEIVNYALLDEKTLSNAIKVHMAFEEIKGKVVKNFSDVLLKNLRDALPMESWKIDFDLIDQPLSKNSGMSIRNNFWPEGLEVGIESQNNTGDFIFAVWVPESISQQKKEKIKSGLNEISEAKQKADVFWSKNIVEKYKNLNTEAALVDFYKGKNGEALEYFTQELVSIAKAVDKNCNDIAQK